MIFDLTEIDKVVVLQALYANAEAAGFGVIENQIKKVEGLTRFDAEKIIGIGNDTNRDSCNHEIDYIYGKPIKWDAITIIGRYLVDLSGYDYCHGYLRAFEVLTATLLKDEISIVTRSYGRDMESEQIMKNVDEADRISKEGLIQLLKECKMVMEPYGRRFYLS